MEYKHILVVVGMLAVLTAAEKINGPCPKIHRISEKVDWVMMHDRWFAIKQSNPPAPQDTKCVQVQIHSALPYLNFTLIKYLSAEGVYEKTYGNGLVRDAGHLSVFVRKPDENWNGVLLEVLDTDYFNFALIYFCRNIEPFNSYQGVYVFSRTFDLDSGLYQRLDKNLKENGLNTTDAFYKITQDCGRIECYGDYGSCQPQN